MNPVLNDVKSYYGIDWEVYENDNTLVHYGTKRHSGRYPWGSGDSPYQRSGDFLSRVDELKKTGKKEREVLDIINSELPKEYQLGTTEFRVAQQKAKHDRQQLLYDRARSLREDGLGYTAIARDMDLSESTVRSMLSNKNIAKRNRAEEIADVLKEEVDKKGMIDISEGVSNTLGISEGQLDEAAYILEAEHGYLRYGVSIPDPTNKRQQTNVTILATPDKDQRYAYQHRDEIESVGDYYSEDGGQTFRKLQRPSSLDSSRVTVRYGDEGGKDMDGVIQIRRGVKDLSLGNSHYAQVRILVDNTHYLKGMAVYADDDQFPPGKDIVFNTNKLKGTPMMGSDETVLKKAKKDPDNPFGAAIAANGQSEYIGEDGKKHLSPINKLKEEGKWDDMSRTLSSQFLSKQPSKLIKQQLDATVKQYQDEYDEIMKYENPAIKRKLLSDFAERADGNASTLKAVSFPGQTSKVLLPLTDIKENECYAPSYENGTKLALVRYPHAGTFEIPIVTVNNKNKSGVNNLGQVMDAIGINSKVAERLSGADFDGDSVTCIPITAKSNIKSTPALKGLEDFDPKVDYAIPEGNPNHVKLMTKDDTQKEMGKVSNLITDMTLRGAPEEDIVRAVKHSMVVIDAEKHKLDYKRSERENGIEELKKKWQIRVMDDGTIHAGGASTLISRKSQTVEVPERQGQGRIDPNTGEIHYRTTGRTFIDPKTGKERAATDKVNIITATPDVRTLSSGSEAENLYADFSNQLKAIANQARKSMVTTGRAKYDPQAAKLYDEEVKSINNKLNKVALNKPKERKAKVIANASIKAKIQAQALDPKKDAKEIRKISQVEMERARNAVSANSSGTKIKFTDKEWEAILSGAISDSKLSRILNVTDSEDFMSRAMPKENKTISTAKQSKAKAMYSSGYTYREIADAIGVPLGSVYDILNVKS